MCEEGRPCGGPKSWALRRGGCGASPELLKFSPIHFGLFGSGSVSTGLSHFPGPGPRPPPRGGVPRIPREKKPGEDGHFLVCISMGISCLPAPPKARQRRRRPAPDLGGDLEHPQRGAQVVGVAAGPAVRWDDANVGYNVQVAARDEAALFQDHCFCSKIWPIYNNDDVHQNAE